MPRSNTSERKRLAADMIRKWKLFVEREHEEALTDLIMSLNVKRLRALDDSMTSVFQYWTRIQKQNEEAERKRKNSIAMGNVP